MSSTSSPSQQNKDWRLSEFVGVDKPVFRQAEPPRTNAQKDRDRIIYSTAFRRLGTITQVLPPGATSSLLHNRLTHSLRVSQLGKRFAESLVHKYKLTSDQLDADRVEAAALAHDLGHPPFGHIGEKVLDKASKKIFREIQPAVEALYRRDAYKEKKPSLDAEDVARLTNIEVSAALSEDELQTCKERAAKDTALYARFEGNAQSTRIVTSLATIGQKEGTDRRGLDLTLGTLAALSKYPWIGDQTDKKWSFYRIDEDLLGHLDSRVPGWRGDPKRWEERDRDGHGPEELMDSRLPETRLMEYADDVTNGPQDISDFYAEGWIDLDRLVSAEEEERFGKKYPKLRDPSAAVYRDLESLARKTRENGHHSRKSRGLVKNWENELIARAENGLGWDHAKSQITIDSTVATTIDVLRKIFFAFVIRSTELEFLQNGQKHLLEEVTCEMWRLASRHCLIGDGPNDEGAVEGRRREDYFEAEGLPSKLKDYIRIGFDDASHSSINLLHDVPALAVARGVIDWVSSLSEPQVIDLHDLICAGRGSYQTSRRWLR